MYKPAEKGAARRKVSSSRSDLFHDVLHEAEKILENTSITEQHVKDFLTFVFERYSFDAVKQDDKENIERLIHEVKSRISSIILRDFHEAFAENIPQTKEDMGLIKIFSNKEYKLRCLIDESSEQLDGFAANYATRNMDIIDIIRMDFE